MKYSNSDLINPKISLFKKKTQNYTKRSLFNLIDIEESLLKNKAIPFAAPSNFYYLKDSEFKDKTKTWRKLNDNLNEVTHNNCIIKLKNNNETSVSISDLQFENENGHKYHFLEKYYIIDIIGEGGFGVVLKCWCKTSKRKVAVKILNKQYYTKSVLQYFEMERQFLLGMKHKNILEILKVEESDDYLLLILELMEWCTLKQLIIKRFQDNDPFTEEECSLIIKNILEGLNYMHSNNIMHRDIKPDNIMFKKIGDLNSLKIIDFGLATFYETKVKRFCGTLKFMAPEMLQDKSYDQTIDTWACGIIVYLLCSGGEHPLGLQSPKDMADFKQNLTLLSDNWKFNVNFPM